MSTQLNGVKVVKIATWNVCFLKIVLTRKSAQSVEKLSSKNINERFITNWNGNIQEDEKFVRLLLEFSPQSDATLHARE